jgi:RNAse (barnase) inhibitor barstar
MTNDINLDLSDIKNIFQFQAAIKKAFDLPDHYGENTDAFWDCITDIIEKTFVIVRGYDSLDSMTSREVNKYLFCMFLYQEKTKHIFSIRIIFD